MLLVVLLSFQGGRVRNEKLSRASSSPWSLARGPFTLRGTEEEPGRADSCLGPGTATF